MIISIFFLFRGIKVIENNLTSEVTDISNYTIDQVNITLDDMGKKIIRQKAVDVAKQLEIYIKNNPQLTVSDLQNDDYFRSIGVQSIGETGYTAVTDVNSLHARLHISDKIENLNLKELSTALPDFWEIISKTKGGIPAEGYYNWSDPITEEIRQKYMYIAIVDAKTSDNVQFSVAATTYINEFSFLSDQTRKNVEINHENIISSITTMVKEFKSKILFFNTITIAIVIIIVILIILKFVISPLTNLTQTVLSVKKGDLEARSKINSNDELGLLAHNFNQMTDSLVSSQEKTTELNNVLKLLNKILRHDILNDLLVATGNIDSYFEYGEKKVDVNQVFHDTQEAIQRGVDFINKMKELELAITSGSNLISTTLSEVVDKSKKEIKGLNVVINGEAKILADVALESVFINFFRNAQIHGGAKNVVVKVDRKEDNFIIRVMDDGKGVPNEIKNSIFKEGFKYGDTGNTGLGLYIIKRTIERYGGEVTVEDNKPHGAVFVIKIPAIPIFGN